MPSNRVLAIGLDGYEVSLERLLIERGELPAIRRLRCESARFLLDHGPAQRSGLAWEQVATGLDPDAAGRWAAVHFDASTYDVWQEGTRLRPFPAQLTARTVVFDAPYFDIDQAPNVRGVLNWGAHDPGVPLGSRPDALLPEFLERFGPYPATEWIYGHVWPSPARARAMGEALAHATDVRARAARWLLAERLPDWDFALVVASEPHSATEGLWHGMDPSHPLHSMPSSAAAHDGLVSVYRAIDRMVESLAGAFPDAAVVLFSTGGMGPNRSDVASMFLLPELLYRHAFGRPRFVQPGTWSACDRPPALAEDEEWSAAVNGHFPPEERSLSQRVRARLRSGLSRVRRPLALASRPKVAEKPHLRGSLEWIPAARYQAHWPEMRAFALPSYYDGRIRINLEGRESRGIVPASQYHAVCDELEALLDQCRDPATGARMVDFIERTTKRDPRALTETESDLVVVWKGIACAAEHPLLGRVGPIPYRRPGGHSGPFGMAYVRGTDLAVGDHGVRSSFDVVPTVCELLGERVPTALSGTSLRRTVASAAE